MCDFCVLRRCDFLLLHVRAAAARGLQILLAYSCMVVSFSCLQISVTFAILGLWMRVCLNAVLSYVVHANKSGKIAANSIEHILNSTPACNGQHHHAVTMSAQPRLPFYTRLFNAVT